MRPTAASGPIASTATSGPRPLTMLAISVAETSENTRNPPCQMIPSARGIVVDPQAVSTKARIPAAGSTQAVNRPGRRGRHSSTTASRAPTSSSAARVSVP